MEERMVGKQLVLVYPIRGEEVLLSIRRKTPWQWCLSGLGGNVKKGARVIATALDEIWEEAEVVSAPIHLEKVAEFKILREGKNPQILHVFLMCHFQGKLKTTEEMGPHNWFTIKNLPIDCMVPGDSHENWVKRILSGEYLRGTIYRSADAEQFLGAEIEKCTGF